MRPIVFDEATMGSATLEIRLGDVDDLASRWLDGFPFGGLFLPGRSTLDVGQLIATHVVIHRPVHSAVLLRATVAWRRLGDSTTLAAGVGLAFSHDSAAQAAHLKQRIDGRARERRSALRCPADERVGIAAESAARVRLSDHDLRLGKLVDVGARGVRVSLGARELGLLERSDAELRVLAPDGSVDASFAFELAWRAGGATNEAGLRLRLDAPEARARWARIYTRARAAFDRRLIDGKR